MEETKRCPYCGEEILATAKKCKHCGEWLEEGNLPNSAELTEANQPADNVLEPSETAQAIDAPLLEGVETLSNILMVVCLLALFGMMAYGFDLDSFNKRISSFFSIFTILPEWVYTLAFIGSQTALLCMAYHGMSQKGMHHKWGIILVLIIGLITFTTIGFLDDENDDDAFLGLTLLMVYLATLFIVGIIFYFSYKGKSARMRSLGKTMTSIPLSLLFFAFLYAVLEIFLVEEWFLVDETDFQFWSEIIMIIWGLGCFFGLPASLQDLFKEEPELT